MTEQEALDFVYTSLVKQGRPSYQIDSSCAYRGTNGRKCAIGWLIPDDKYQIEFDMKDPTLGVICAARLYGFSERFLEGLQGAHDNCGELTFVEDLHDNMARFASQNGLEFREPKCQ